MRITIYSIIFESFNNFTVHVILLFLCSKIISLHSKYIINISLCFKISIIYFSHLKNNYIIINKNFLNSVENLDIFFLIHNMINVVWILSFVIEHFKFYFVLNSLMYCMNCLIVFIYNITELFIKITYLVNWILCTHLCCFVLKFA